ncbi:MAG TPA: hypothetical protein VGW11_11215 [Solirubrobacteraceae bacterium]|nr:hypothetical protein [Solirubrobacteraceae bacterium]
MSFKTRQYPNLMESATLSRSSGSAGVDGRGAAPQGGPEGYETGVPGSTRLRRLERGGLLAVSLVALIGFLLYPTYPTYDSIYSMVWGRELLDLQPLSFEAYRAPTEHPLAIVIGAVLSPLGDVGARLWVALCIASFVALVAGLYTMGKLAFTPLVGAAAAALLLTRFDFAFLAARGYIDPAFLAMVVWAGVLEMRRPRRGTSVLVILALAGLLRPEAWLLAGLYWLWVAWPRADAPSVRRRAAWLPLVAAAPVVWATTDLLVTGDPLFSFTGTTELAAELGRAKGIEAVPGALWTFLIDLDKFPVVIAGILGLVLAAWLAPTRLRMPLALFLAGVGTFAVVGLGGLSVIARYLLVPSLMVMLFAGVAVAGWTMLNPGTWARRVWVAGAVCIVLGGVVFTATRVNLVRLDNELTFRGQWRASLEQVLEAPDVRAALACGPVSVPNHKLIPDVRWILDLPPGQVVARSDPDSVGRYERGVSVLVHGRQAVFSQVLPEESSQVRHNLPLPGYERAATSEYYGAYVNC